MFGSDPFGSVPFGASGSTPFDYDAMLASSREALVYTVTLQVWNIAGDTLSTLYLGSAEWATSPTDIPASTPFDGRLTTVLNFSRSIVGDRIGINFTSGDGTIAWANPDGAYDAYVDGYAVDRREVIVRVGRKTDAFADHLVIFTGVAVDWAADQDTVTLTVRDKGDLLNVPASPNVYAGTGGEEGGSDLTGKRKPYLRGAAVTGVSGTLVSSSLLIYQVNDGPITSVAKVFDRGVELFGNPVSDEANYAALAAASMSAGTYRHCTAEGFFRYGSTPAGILLVQVSGAADVETTGEIVREALAASGGLGDAELDEGSFDALDVAQPAEIGFFIDQGDAATVAEASARLMSAIGGWGGFGRRGLFEVGIFTAPAGDPVAYFARDEGDIIDLSREKLPSGTWPPPWRVRVAYSRSETTFNDFAGAAAADVQLFFSQPYRLVEASDSGVLTDHPLAQDLPPIEAYFTTIAEAQNEADRVLALYTSGYRLYRMTLTRRALTLDIGDLIHVTFPRFGLDAGKLLRVAGIDDRIQIGDGSDVDQVEVTAFG